MLFSSATLIGQEVKDIGLLMLGILQNYSPKLNFNKSTVPIASERTTIVGANSRLYIYINQIQSLENILSSPNNYKNRPLNTVSERHLISVEMLTYIYEGDFTNEDI